MTAGKQVVPSRSGRKLSMEKSFPFFEYSLIWTFWMREPRSGIQCSGKWNIVIGGASSIPVSG
jgi:hypothetical protein